MTLSNALYLIVIINSISSNEHHITERSLLFPQYSVLQFTYGVSAPVILPNRTFQLSLCMQQNYDLPFNVSNFLITTYNGRGQSDNDGYDIERHTFYEYIIDLLNGFGFDGELCLLRAICELSETPMYRDDDNTLLENIVHYIFTPSLDDAKDDEDDNDDVDADVDGDGDDYKETFYAKVIEAENLGKINGNCMQKYEQCELSLVDLFTNKILT